MMPAALKKAEALIRHAQYMGVKPAEFMVAVTLGEAYELLDYLVAVHDSALLKRDIAEAKEACDPWPVLENFNLLGLAITRADGLH